MPVTILLIMQFSAGVRKISTILSSTKKKILSILVVASIDMILIYISFLV